MSLELNRFSRLKPSLTMTNRMGKFWTDPHFLNDDKIFKTIMSSKYTKKQF